MNYSDLETIVRQNKTLASQFVGVFAANTLPADIKGKGFSIIFIPNVEIGHFVCYSNIYKPYFLDTFGNSPAYYNLPNKISYNKTQIQQESSCLCGAYILYILYHSLKYKIEIGDFIAQTFNPEDLKKNDSIVFAWIKQAGLTKNLLRCS